MTLVKLLEVHPGVHACYLITISIEHLGFDFFGSFLQVYSQFNIAPDFKPKFFNNTILKFNDSSNKKPMAYWDSIRPLPLLVEEIKDYQKINF